MEHKGTIITTDILATLSELIAEWDSNQIFILTDKNTQKLCLPLLTQIEKLANAKKTTICPDDSNKNLTTAAEIWAFLVENSATRHSLMINVGGGVITDIGGFTASTFKRGISYINVATSLLGAVDAATGGKTGINFNGFKNEIGVFELPYATVIDTRFFKTLDRENLISGYAEMIKHALIYSEQHLQELIQFDLTKIDFELFAPLLSTNVKIKEDIAANDPREMGLRKALNFGHTIGHALESFFLQRGDAVLHGYAVAWGMICELALSVEMLGFPLTQYYTVRNYLLSMYGKPNIKTKDMSILIELMKHDKKNRLGEINFTLLKGVGNVEINQLPDTQIIIKSIEKGLLE